MNYETAVESRVLPGTAIAEVHAHCQRAWVETKGYGQFLVIESEAVCASGRLVFEHDRLPIGPDGRVSCRQVLELLGY